MAKYILKYIGAGFALPGVPARDLSAGEVAERNLDEQTLLKSGLWEKGKSEPETEQPEEVSDAG